MSDKTERIVVLDVDLECHRCDKKIRKVLDKYGDDWDIKSFGYDTKNNKVTLTGPFQPEKLIKRLCKKAGHVIREWCIKEPPKPAPPSNPEPPKKPDPPPAEPPKKPDPPPAEPPKKPDPPPKKPDPPPADPPKKPDPPPKKPDPPPAEPPKKPDPPPKKPDPPPAEPPKKPDPPRPCADPPCPPAGYPYPYPYPLPIFYPWGGCEGQHHKPCSCGGSCGGYRPCACGCGGGCSGPYQPQQPTYVDYGRPCHWVCEEEPAATCSIM